jgi:hypothetical protein
VFHLTARLLVAACLCTAFVGTTALTTSVSAQAPAPSTALTAADAQDAAAAKPLAKPASRQLRHAYGHWRKRLKRYGAYVGRNLLTTARAADDATAVPTRPQLRHAIHRMQKRLHHYLHTSRGREAGYRLKVKTIPAWGRSSLSSIAQCESHGNPGAIGGGGAYRGMYQFSFSTWAVVGGSGDPAAASPAEQTWRAWLLLSRYGSGHWPVCG